MSLKQPVRYPVKYYSHLDAGAPQLADIDGNIKTILKAGLVTGIGDKEGAGWTALFEDDFRIVLRRPLRTGNPPDIKIENGVINGAASHRIVSQDNPNGLDDVVELTSVNLLARDSKHRNEWHLIVSDFGFLLCYQMAENGFLGEKNNICYCGSVMKMRESDPTVFVALDDPKIAVSGTSTINQNTLISAGMRLKNMRSNIVSNSKLFIDLLISEIDINNDYLAQSIIVMDGAMLPFYCALPAYHKDAITKKIEIEGRPMLRYVNQVFAEYSRRALYIPLDYWQL